MWLCLPQSCSKASRLGLLTPRNHRVGKGEKIMNIIIAPALEEHPRAPSVSTTCQHARCGANQNTAAPLLKDTPVTAHFKGFWIPAITSVGFVLATEGIQKAMKNETFSETTFLLVRGERLDRGTLVACKKREEYKVCRKA